jgi:hypothetical protein
MTGAEIDRFSGAGHLMQKYLRSIFTGKLWFLTTAKGVSRETVAAIQKRIHRLQLDRDFYAYSAWCFETRPKLHAHFLFVGDSAVVERLKRSYGTIITIGDRHHPDKPVYDLPRLIRGYLAKERTPQAGFGRWRQLGWRIEGSHRLEGGGDRIRLSHQLERDAIQAGLVVDRPHINAKRKADRKEYRKRPLTARATRLSGQILLPLPELSKPVNRLRAFGGGIVPPAVAEEIEFRREQRGLSQSKLASLVGRSQGTLSNALCGRDPISARVVNRLRDLLA